MPSSLSDRVLALGGIFQAAGLVQQAARTGQTEAAAFEASIRSVFTIDAPSIEEIFGGVRGVELRPRLVDVEGATSQTEDVSTPENTRICKDQSSLLLRFHE